MREQRIKIKDMDYAQRRAYFNQKNREYRERVAALNNRKLQRKDPNSHPTKMTPEERLAYNRIVYHRFLMKNK